MAAMPALRLVRSVVFASVCTVVSGLGHAMVSGTGVPLWALLYALAAVTAAVWWVTGKQRGAPVILGGSVITQFVLHCVFMLGQMAAGAPAAAAVPGMPAPGTGLMASMPGMAGMASMPGMPGMTGPATGSGPMAGPGGGTAMHEWSPGMLLSHTVVALACGLWMWRGEVAVYRLVRSLAWMLAAPLRFVLAPTVPDLPAGTRVRAGGAPRFRPTEAFLRHALVRRGPPSLAVRF